MFKIQFALTDHKFTQYQLEVHFVFEKIVAALSEVREGEMQSPSLVEKMIKLGLELFYYWV